MTKQSKTKYIYEFIGTAILVFCGIASTRLGGLAISLTFGATLALLIFVIGPVSGCHINPAISLVFLLNKKIKTNDFWGYLISQFLGGLVGGLLIHLLFATAIAPAGAWSLWGANNIARASFWGFFGVFITEVFGTAIFLFVILLFTSKKSYNKKAPIVIGATLTFLHLITLGLSTTSLNPARSLGPAISLFIFGGSTKPLIYLSVFCTAPFVGGIVGWALFKNVYKNDKEVIEFNLNYDLTDDDIVDTKEKNLDSQEQTNEELTIEREKDMT